jgi:hypothetical protein
MPIIILHAPPSASRLGEPRHITRRRPLPDGDTSGTWGEVLTEWTESDLEVGAASVLTITFTGGVPQRVLPRMGMNSAPNTITDATGVTPAIPWPCDIAGVLGSGASPPAMTTDRLPTGAVGDD